VVYRALVLIIKIAPLPHLVYNFSSIFYVLLNNITE
jgi:hypothetical protein